jgi:hypothetical protein
VHQCTACGTTAGHPPFHLWCRTTRKDYLSKDAQFRKWTCTIWCCYKMVAPSTSLWLHWHIIYGMFMYLHDRYAARTFVAQSIPFPPAAYVSKRPAQAGVRQMRQYQRHNDILYANITLKRIPNSRYVEEHWPVALIVMAGVHKSFKNSRSRVEIVGARMMTWSKIHTGDPLANTWRQRTKFSRSGDRDSCAPWMMNICIPYLTLQFGVKTGEHCWFVVCEGHTVC